MSITQIRHYIQHHGEQMFFVGFMSGIVVLAASMSVVRALIIG